MNISRRDFMKVFGASVASLLMTGCRIPFGATCYAPMPPPTDTVTTRGRLRALWLRFNELAQDTSADYAKAETEMGEWTAQHRYLLDMLFASGALTAPVTDLVQEAYTAALYHVWRSNAPITCYEPMIVDYQPVSAQVLVQQSQALSEASSQGNVDPETLSKARAALEHDMAYYALSEADVQALYDRLIAEWQNNNQPAPGFDALPLELTPDAKAAAQFIVDLLAGK
jgi:hypothetical protein